MFFSHSSRPQRKTQPSHEHTTAWYYFQTLAQESADVFWILMPTGEMPEVCPSWQNFTGQEEQACLEQGWLDMLYPADQMRIKALLHQAITSSHSAEGRCYIRGSDGFYHLMHIRAIPVHIPHEAQQRVIICGDDLTKQALAGEMSNAQMQHVVRACGVGLWCWDFITNQLVWTEQEYALFGLSSAKPITYERFLQAIHPDDREHVIQLRMPAQTATPERGEHFRTIWPDGTVRWLENRAQAVHDAEGKPVRIVGATIDITDLKHIEEALRESEVRFRGLVDSNIIGMSVTDMHGHIYEANEALLSFLEYTREDLQAGRMQWMEMTPLEYREESIQHMGELLTTGIMQPFEKEFVTNTGKRVPALLGSTLIRQGGSEPLMLTFILDLTARKELERQKDLMLGMTSHELKTPLTALKGTFQLIQRRVKRLVTKTDVPVEVRESLTDLSERLDTCARQVDAQTHLINDLMDVSRITAHTLKLELKYCDLVSIVRATVEDLRIVALGRILLLTLPEHATVTVLADSARIGQVVTNYVTNALRYSSPDQPVEVGLTIESRVARVWVRDKGPGLTAEAQKELWQRFHQVKGILAQSDTGKGLGLGLYICRTLIFQHQGEVGVESTQGEGSTFWFTLPLAQ